jgi:tripartite-type tricarboxylate transporter receptor subunit TctC
MFFKYIMRQTSTTTLVKKHRNTYAKVLIGLIELIGLCVLTISNAQTIESNYPTKPIRIIVPQSSGSATDTLIRLLAPKLTEQLGRALVIENKLGAGGILGADAVAKAPPDGYTLLVGATSWITIAPQVYKQLSYDPQKDFAPISIFAVGQNVLAVSAILCHK